MHKTTGLTVRIKDQPASPPLPAKRPAGQALSASEATFRALAETASEAILSANLEGEVTYWNKGAERMFGYTAAEAAGKPLVLIMGSAWRQACRCLRHSSQSRIV